MPYTHNSYSHIQRRRPAARPPRRHTASILVLGHNCKKYFYIRNSPNYTQPPRTSYDAAIVKPCDTCTYGCTYVHSHVVCAPYLAISYVLLPSYVYTYVHSIVASRSSTQEYTIFSYFFLASTATCHSCLLELDLLR